MSLLLTVLSLGVAVGLPAQTAPATDLILVQGKIITMNSADDVVEALAIRNGQIVAVGPTRDVLSLRGPKTRVIDLHGRTATPGLIDTHAHIVGGGIVKLFRIDLSNATTVQDVVRRVSEKAATLKPGEWIVGRGWDEGKLAEHRYVYARDLDAVAAENPVWLTHTTGHYGVANTAGLRLAGITAATPDPPAGTIDRDAQGRPTGVLKERAQALVVDRIAPATFEQERGAILDAIEELHREGMTAVKDPAIGPQTWDAYRSLLDSGKLNEHVFTLFHAGNTFASALSTLARLSQLPRPPASLGDGVLFAGGAKIFLDGSGGARTAWVYEQWNKESTGTDSGNYGYPVTDPQVYRQMVRLFHEAGITVGTHAVGDRATDWVVDTYAAVLRAKPTRGLRHSVIHANIPTDHAIQVMADLEKRYDAAYPESQGPFMWWIGDNYAGNFGPRRSRRLNPFRTYVANGIHWGGGSDYPVTPLPARYGIWASIERMTLNGLYGSHPFGTHEAVDVHVALRSYTSWAARQLFLEDRVGTLEPGKQADIAVWDRDLYAVPTAELKDMKCEMTIFGGKIVFQSAQSPITVSD